MKSKREIVYNKIRNSIFIGELKPGEKLVENNLCETFHAGRTPLREALLQLQAEGLVNVIPNKGAFIPTLSIGELEEIYDIISILEGYATEKATMCITATHKKELKAIKSDLEKAGLAKDYKIWSEKNTKFHAYFSEISGNLHLPKIIKSLRDRIYKYRYFSIVLPGHIEHYIHDHKIILEAVFKKEAEEAGKLMRNHILYTKEVLIEFIRNVSAFK
jgi:DNA-binding GntR family transcriptional regulator